MISLSAMKWWIFATAFIAVLFAERPDVFAEGAPTVPECRGRNLLDDLKTKNPSAYARWLASASQIPNGQALFWRITGKDPHQPSWLLGTAHVTDPRILALEVRDIDKPWADFFNMLFALPLVYLPDEKTWRDYLSPAELELMNVELAQYGYTINDFERIQPWAAVLSLFGYPNCEAWRVYLGRYFLDADLANRARRAGKPIVGLETRYESSRTIAKMSLKAQFRTMLTYARLPVTPEDEYETGIQIYMNRLIPLYMQFENSLYELSSDELEALREFNRYTLDERNATMLDRALPLIEGGNAFIAVGAAHLPGDQGLVELFRKSGYEVTPVN
jgi:uncharacterized protein YbaP (TraB family)